MRNLFVATFLLCFISECTLFGQAPTISRVVDTASLGTQLAPGSLANIVGTNLGTSTSISVTVGGKPCAVLSASAAQLQIQIAVDAPLGSTTVQVGTSAPFGIVLQQYAPAMYSADGTGKGNVQAYSPTGELISVSNPPLPGDVVVVFANSKPPNAEGEAGDEKRWSEMQSAGERLAALGLQVRTIRALSDRKSRQFDLWQARDMFRQLKDQLRDEDREMSTVRGEARLTEGEQRWYKSAVHEAYWGTGRRRGFLSNLHLGALDTEKGGFAMLGKTFKGLTDEMLRWQTQELLKLEIGRDAHTVYVEPKLVAEIAFNEIQASPHYPSGLALRFARVKRYRSDKSAAQSDTFQTVQQLAGLPKKSHNSV